MPLSLRLESDMTEFRTELMRYAEEEMRRYERYHVDRDRSDAFMYMFRHKAPVPYHRFQQHFRDVLENVSRHMRDILHGEPYQLHRASLSFMTGFDEYTRLPVILQIEVNLSGSRRWAYQYPILVDEINDVMRNIGCAVDVTDMMEEMLHELRIYPPVRDFIQTPRREVEWMVDANWDIGRSAYSTEYPANMRALELIMQFIPEEYIETLVRNSEGLICIAHCTGSHTTSHYRIRGAVYSKGSKSFTIESDSHAYCLVPKVDFQVPVFDHVLAVWLLITTNEIEFLNKANILY